MQDPRGESRWRTPEGQLPQASSPQVQPQAWTHKASCEPTLLQGWWDEWVTLGHERGEQPPKPRGVAAGQHLPPGTNRGCAGEPTHPSTQRASPLLRCCQEQPWGLLTSSVFSWGQWRPGRTLSVPWAPGLHGHWVTSSRPGHRFGHSPGVSPALGAADLSTF